RDRLLDRETQALVGDLDEAAPLGADPAHRDRAAHVRPEAVEHEAQVEADEVAVLDLPLAGDAVDGLLVDGDADRLREAVIPEEPRPRPRLADAAVVERV